MRAAYVLLIEVKRSVEVVVGSLGQLHFPSGFYCYVGSSPLDNVAKRLKRYMRKEKKLRWHIDYLLSAPEVEVRAAFILPDEEECEVSRGISRVSLTAIRGFGSSGCSSCEGHLYLLPQSKGAVEVLSSVL